jgi:hypothetical protein
MRGSAAFRTGVAPGGALAGPWVRNPLWRNARAIPSLDLDFANNKSLTDRVTSQNLVTFTRASTGRFVGSDGLIQTAAVNDPRFDHNPTTGESLGLLVEEARTNIALRSEEFNNASWTKTRSSITADAVVAPDGATTADKLIASIDTNTHSVVQNVTLTVAAWTFSIFLKQAEYTSARILVFDGIATTYAAIFNLSAGTLTSTTGSPLATSINASGNGFWRCGITVTGTVVAGNVQVRPVSGGNDNFTGDGTSGIYLWGAQLEAGAFATSYIPTTSATVTRAADVASITGSNFSSFYNSSAGTLFAEYRTPASGLRGVADFNDNTANERIALLTSGTDPKMLVVDGGATQADLDGGTIVASTMTKTAVAYAVNDFSIVHAAGTAVTDTSGTLPTVDRLLIGADQASNYQNGRIKRLTYWPTRLSNTVLQQITQP